MVTTPLFTVQFHRHSRAFTLTDHPAQSFNKRLNIGKHNRRSRWSLEHGQQSLAMFRIHDGMISRNDINSRTSCGVVGCGFIATHLIRAHDDRRNAPHAEGTRCVDNAPCGLRRCGCRNPFGYPAYGACSTPSKLPTSEAASRGSARSPASLALKLSRCGAATSDCHCVMRRPTISWRFKSTDSSGSARSESTNASAPVAGRLARLSRQGA